MAHDMVTGPSAAYSRLPGTAFLSFLVGEAWVNALQMMSDQ